MKLFHRVIWVTDLGERVTVVKVQVQITRSAFQRRLEDRASFQWAAAVQQRLRELQLVECRSGQFRRSEQPRVGQLGQRDLRARIVGLEFNCRLELLFGLVRLVLTQRQHPEVIRDLGIGHGEFLEHRFGAVEAPGLQVHPRQQLLVDSPEVGLDRPFSLVEPPELTQSPRQRQASTLQFRIALQGLLIGFDRVFVLSLTL